MRSLILSILILFSVKPVFSQIEILNSKIIQEKKFVKTYVILNSWNKPEAEQFTKVFRENWTVTPVLEFISYAESVRKMEPNTLYFSFKENIKSEFVPDNRGYEKRPDKYITTTYYSFELSTFKDRFFEKGKNIGKVNKKGNTVISYTNSDVDVLANILLSYKSQESLSNIQNFNGNNNFNNWQPRFIKNYLQQIQSAFKSPEDKNLQIYVSNSDALRILKNDTLYITDEIDVEKYPYPRIVLTRQELSDKILGEEKPFYYLMSTEYVKGQIVLVTNSKTGEVLYQSVRPKGVIYLNKTIAGIVKSIDKKAK